MRTPGADDRYDEDYFMRGVETKKSLYSSYRWLPDLTVPMCQTIADYCGIELSDRILDFGCARGYSVKAFRILGFEAWGKDVSEWALSNADPEVRQFVGHNWPIEAIDWIVAKDVLEHVPKNALTKLIPELFVRARKGIFIVVPLANSQCKSYIVPEYEADVTHVIRWPLWSWASTFIAAMPPGWELTSTYRVKGVKDNYSQFERGNGFITLRKV